MNAPDAAHDQQIQTVFDGMVRAWAHSDAYAFAAAFAEDADFTSVRGDHLVGRAAIAAAHDRLFTTAYSGTRLRATIRSIRYPREDLAVARVDFALLTPGGQPATGLSGNPGHHLHGQAVLQALCGSWKIIAFMNMVPLQAADPTQTHLVREGLA